MLLELLYRVIEPQGILKISLQAQVISSLSKQVGIVEESAIGSIILGLEKIEVVLRNVSIIPEGAAPETD